MNLKTPKKLLAEILPHALKREVNLITTSDMYWGQAQKSTELKLHLKGQKQYMLHRKIYQLCGDGREVCVFLRDQQRWIERARIIDVETYLLAQHSDGSGITQLIHNLRPQHVIFVHGSPTYLADLTSLEELQNRYHLHSPQAGTLVELPIGETFLQPAPPETNYEGELNELGAVVTIALPEAIIADPRWRSFADTGLVEARWQGQELVLRGLSQRELLNQSSDRLIWADMKCCGTCRFQRGQRCGNPASPLFNFKVTPEGYCPAFERLSDPEPNAS